MMSEAVAISEPSGFTDAGRPPTTPSVLAAASSPFMSETETEEHVKLKEELEEVGSTTFAERTLVEGGDGEEREGSGSQKHQLGSSSSLSLPAQQQKPEEKHVDEQNEDAERLNAVVSVHPLALLTEGNEGEEDEKGLGKITFVNVDEDVVDSTGKVLYPDSDSPGPGPGGLHLDIKPASPLPWEVVAPGNSKGNIEFYSPAASKFRTLQKPRPLIPKSSYYFGPPPADSGYGTAPVGQIGVHHPREILRVERDYTGGEVIQFAPIYPLELEGRITPTHFLETINGINELLISAHSVRHSLLDNILGIFTLQLSKLVMKTHFEKEMERLRRLMEELNREVYNPVGLNVLWPENVGFLFLEIEYY